MKPAEPFIGRVAWALNGLGMWSREQPVWGRRMRARTFDRTLYLSLHRLGLMGRPERRALGRLVRPGMTAVDVGANLGLYSMLLSRLVGPSGRVISFEPDPDLFALLRENCAANAASNVEARGLALGGAAGRLSLNRLTFNSGDNHLGAASGETFRRPVEVEVAALDRLMPGLEADFIKIDVQGWELNVLRGMEELLRRREKVGLFLEVCPKWLRRAGDSAEELYAFTRALGLRVYSTGDFRELSEASFMAMAAGLRGQGHIDVFVSRTPPADGSGTGRSGGK
jgi:FkbM family methyltransferase